jgi:hypothetical protein
MADSDWSDSSSGGASSSSSRKKGHGGSGGGSSSNSGGGGDPYSILTILRGALSGSGSKSDVRPVSYKHGGKVRKTGQAKVHRGEVVIPADKVRKLRKALGRTKKRGGRKSSGR